MHHRSKPLYSIWQAVSIIAITITLVSGVTFAALQSQQVVMKGNSIQTALANLKLSYDNYTYANTLNGYTFDGLIPGGSPVPSNGYPVYARNDGSSALALKLSANSTLTNASKTDLSKVHVILTPLAGGAPQNITLADLVAANTTGGVALTASGANHLGLGSVIGFNLQIMMDSDALAGSSATISNLDFDFDATAVS